MRDVVAGERGVPDLARGRRSDAVRAAPLRRRPGLDLSGLGIDAAIDPALASEPDDAGLAKHQRVEIGVRKCRRQREQLDLLGLGIDARDRVLAAFGEPGVAVRSDDDAVWRRARPKRDLLELACLWI